MVEKLQKLIDESNYIVFFGGAGVSTESGIKDFRGKNGLYKEKNKYANLPPEYMLSHSCLVDQPKLFFEYYKDKMDARSYKPNVTHKYLVKLEKSGKLKAIVTQNIDGLHQKAGSNTVYELHGSVLRNYCMKCNKFYTAEDVFNSEGIPKCTCGGVIKPNVVLYEEGLDQDNTSNAIKEISNADMLIIGGTSLTVYPAAAYVNYFRGKYLVVINRDKISCGADLEINDSIGKVFEEIDNKLYK